MDWEEIEQAAAIMIEDLDLLLKRKEIDRAYLMLLQDVYRKYAEIGQILLSWNHPDITEIFLSGQDAFEKVMDGVERQEPVSEVSDRLYEFGQRLLMLRRCLSMEEKYFIIIYGINRKTPNYLHCLDLTKTFVMAFAVKDKAPELTEYMGIPVIDIEQVQNLEYDYLLCTEEPEEADRYPYEKILNLHSHIGTFVTGGYEVAYERMNFYRDRGPYDGIVTGLSYIRQGIDLDSIHGHFLNFAIGGQDIFYSYQMFRYAYEHAKEPERIRYAIVGLSPYIFQYDMSMTDYNAAVAERYYSFLRRMNHFAGAWLYKGAYHYAKDRLDQIMKEDFEEIYTTTEEENFLNYERNLRSVVYDSSSLDEKGIQAEKISIEKEYHKNYPETEAFNIRTMREYLDELKQRQVKAILVMPPMTKLYRKYMSWDMYQDTMRILAKLQEEYAFTFVNLLTDLELEDKYFRNSSHLNGAGAVKVTECLNQYISLHQRSGSADMGR